jgi:hypothetical protein
LFKPAVEIENGHAVIAAVKDGLVKHLVAGVVALRHAGIAQRRRVA